MSEHLYYKAQTLVKKGCVKLIDAKKGNLHFVLTSPKHKQDIDVFRTSSGAWSCNAVGIKMVTSGFGHKKKQKFGCVFFNQEHKDCSHTLACKMWLKQYSTSSNRKVECENRKSKVSDA